MMSAHTHVQTDTQTEPADAAGAALAATLARLEVVARAIGVTRLANITGLDMIGLPVWTAIRPTSRVLATSQGKGMSHLQAKVSALMESIEIWHAESHCTNLVFESPLRLTAATGLPWVAPRSLAVLEHVRISDLEPMLWTHGTHLMTGAAVLLPWEAVSLNTLPTTARRGLRMSSSGLAGGAGKWEAILHGLCELVERHEMGRWFQWDLAARATRQVDLSRLGGVPRELVERISPHCMIGLWDMTGELGMPSYACMLADHPAADAGLEVGSTAGFATHACAATAAQRAMLEAVQARATMLAGSRDDLGDDEFSAVRDPDQVLALQREIAEGGRRGRALRGDADMAGLAPAAAVRQLLALFQAHGIADAYVVDLSDARFDIPVFKCVVPQLTDVSIGTIMQEIKMNHRKSHWSAVLRAQAEADAKAGATAGGVA